MRTKSEDSLKQLIERLKAEKDVAIKQLAQRKLSTKREKKQEEAEKRRRRGDVLERERQDRWDKDPKAKVQEMQGLDERLSHAADRAAFGLAPRVNAAPTSPSSTSVPG